MKNLNKHILKYILSLLIIAATICLFQTPIITYADDSSSISQLMNLQNYSSNEEDISSNESADYLYWAASARRCGVMYYVLDNLGYIRAQGILLDKSGRDKWGEYANKVLNPALGYNGILRLEGRITSATASGVTAAKDNIDYVSSVSTVYYSDGWQAKGSDAMAYLMEDSDKTLDLPNGTEIPLPRWASYVWSTGTEGQRALLQLANPGTEWKVLVEPVTVSYIYTADKFSRDMHDTTGMLWEAGSPKPAGSTVVIGGEERFVPNVYLGTAWRLVTVSNQVSGEGGGPYTYKFYNKRVCE